jgi:hypothetical protein
VTSATSFATAVSYISDLIDKGRKLEAQGREIAIRRRELISREDVEWINGMYNWHPSLASRIEAIADLVISRGEFDAISNVCDLGRALAFDVSDAPKTGRGEFERGTPLFKLLKPKRFGNVVTVLHNYCVKQQELSGRSAFLIVDYMYSGDYTWSDFARDFTSCFSLFLNWVAERLGSIREVIYDMVYASTRSMPVAVDCARIWALSLKHYYSWGLIIDSEYRGALGFVRENEVVFRLGEKGEKHGAHAVFAPLSARVEYYFPRMHDEYDVYREMVHVVFAGLSEHYGCRVVEQKPGECTIVEIPRSAFEDFFQGVLALVISMGARIRRPDVYWGMSFHRKLKEEFKRLSEQVKDPATLEYELCLTAYKLMREVFRT